MFRALASLEHASVNRVVAMLIWPIVHPMMIAIDFGSLREADRAPSEPVITLAVDGLIFNHLFAGWIARAKAPEYIPGPILPGAAPSTAMRIARWCRCR